MKKLSFDQGWEVSEASGLMAMFMQVKWQPVTLPHDAMIGKPRAASSPGGANVGYFPGSVASYRKKFTVPQDWEGQRVLLEFEGVYMNAEVAVNHQPVYLHPYGYTSFIVDITPYLVIGKENEISVVANNTAQPNSRWYSGTGIYRHVWLRMGEPVHIKPWGVFVTTPVVDPALSVVQVSTELEGLNSLEGATLTSTILTAAGEEVARVESATRLPAVQQSLLVTNARLWSIDQPNLYTLRSELKVGGRIVDAEETTFGIRAITIDAENGLRLNGVPVKLKGGCIHHDHGPLGAAAFDRAEERKVELLKSAGYNALRSAHNPPSPALLDACDRLGFLVLDETFDSWTVAKTPNDYHLNFVDWWQRDTESMVRRDRNHPSVFLWSIGNEIPECLGSPAGAAWAQRQADLVRSLDPTRPVTSALLGDIFAAMEGEQGGQGEGEGDVSSFFSLPPVPEELEKDRWAMATAAFSRALDVVGYNYQCNRYEADGKKFPGRVIAGTETWGDMSYIFWNETARLPHVIGDFIWTAFDYIGEAGFGKVWVDEKPQGMFAAYPYHLYGCGDFDICGVKRPQSYYRELLWGVRSAPFIAVFDPQLYGKKLSFTPWAWEPALDTWTFPGQEGKPVQVHVYSVDDEVELWINGQSQGRQPAGTPVKNKARFDVTYQPGTIEAVGYKDGRETGRHRLVTAADPAALVLTADRPQVRADPGSIVYVDIAVTDQAGVLVRHVAPEIVVEVSGAGELLALGSGNPLSEEMYTASQRKAFQGHLLAVVRSSGQPGKMVLSARTEGLPGAKIELLAE